MGLNENIAKIVKANGANFYGTETAQEDDNTIFRVFITQEGGVSLDLCAEISNELSPFLDVHPPMSQAYRLEISSPGIERKLVKPVHFINAIGEKVKFKLGDGNKLKGTLKSADNTSATVETKAGEETYAYADLNTCKTYFEW